MRKISEQSHIFLMHAAISYYFIQIVDMNRVEMQNICMGLYRNVHRLTQILKITTLFEGKKLKSSISSCLFVLANIP